MLQSVLDQFEALTLGPSGPGQQQDETQDPAYYPRPVGEDAALSRVPPPTVFPGNCSPRFMRLTVNAVPSQQVLLSYKSDNIVAILPGKRSCFSLISILAAF